MADRRPPAQYVAKDTIHSLRQFDVALYLLANGHVEIWSSDGVMFHGVMTEHTKLFDGPDFRDIAGCARELMARNRRVA